MALMTLALFLISLGPISCRLIRAGFLCEPVTGLTVTCLILQQPGPRMLSLQKQMYKTEEAKLCIFQVLTRF